jgi:hypothetical protein
MIAFQSSAIAECLNHRTIIPCHARVLPAGEGRGEGELANRGRQSALIRTSMPALRIRVNSRNSRKKLRAAPAWSNLIRPIEDLLPPTPHGRTNGFGWPVKPNQGESSDSQEKKIVYLFTRKRRRNACPTGKLTLAAKLTPRQTKSRPKQTKKCEPLGNRLGSEKTMSFCHRWLTYKDIVYVHWLSPLRSHSDGRGEGQGEVRDLFRHSLYYTAIPGGLFVF